MEAAPIPNELRYDGEIPAQVAAVERHGGARAAAYVAACGNRASYRSFVLGQIRTIRGRRGDGSFYPELVADLHVYRRGFRSWNAVAWRLRRELGLVPARAAAA